MSERYENMGPLSLLGEIDRLTRENEELRELNTTDAPPTPPACEGCRELVRLLDRAKYLVRCVEFNANVDSVDQGRAEAWRYDAHAALARHAQKEGPHANP